MKVIEMSSDLPIAEGCFNLTMTNPLATAPNYELLWLLIGILDCGDIVV